MVKTLLKNISLALTDYQLAFIMFIFRHRYVPNFKSPRSFNEKINYLRLYNRNSLRSLIADRLKVRDYIKSKTSQCSFPKIYWHGVDFTPEVWKSLPEKFVIKANHGSKMVKIIDKKDSDYEEIKLLTDCWLKSDYAKYGREWWYKNLEKYLLVEEKLEVDGDVPNDFKFFVCSGNVEIVQRDVDRFKEHKRVLYNRNFEFINAGFTIPSDDTKIIAKPKPLDLAINIAEQLGADFDFIRVDFYLCNDKVYFGELTNAPGNGFERITPRSFDFYMGSKLPEKILK